MIEPWPPAPVEISGKVVLKLLGKELAVITLELVIAAADRLARWTGPGGQVHTLPLGTRLDELPAEPVALAGLPPRETGGPRRHLELKGNGQGAEGDGQLEEILDLLEKTSKMLE